VTKLKDFKITPSNKHISEKPKKKIFVKGE